MACQPGSCVQITRDRGATWQQSTPLAAGAVDFVSTYDGRNGYASVFSDGVSHIMRTSDGGVTWSELAALSAMPDRAVEGLAQPDGGLLMTRSGQDGGMYRLRAGTTVVGHLASAPTHANAFYITGGVVVAASAWTEGDTPDLGSVAQISTDGGTTWIDVPVR